MVLGGHGTGAGTCCRQTPGTNRLERGFQNDACQYQCPCSMMSSPNGCYQSLCSQGCLLLLSASPGGSQVLASGSEPDSFKITASSLDVNLVRLCVCPLTAQSVASLATPVLPYKRSVDFQKLGCILILFVRFYFSAGSVSHGLSLVVANGDYSRYSAWAYCNASSCCRAWAPGAMGFSGCSMQLW